MVMMNLLGSQPADADYEVRTTKCAHAKTTYLKDLFKHHIER
ncbi:hypothetical protein A2U01_0051016, partial [Trifolium medium]|nr:hypothetical protein [Trifolium medium]